jgi:hypothetical protein
VPPTEPDQPRRPTPADRFEHVIDLIDCALAETALVEGRTVEPVPDPALLPVLTAAAPPD